MPVRFQVMRLDWFQPRKLARRLAAGDVPNREVASLMLTNLLFGSLLFYGAFTTANPPWNLLSAIEALVIVSVTVIGFTKVYDAAGGERNSSFAVLFSCLSFGVWFWTTAIVWSVFWAVWWAVRIGYIKTFNFQPSAFSRNLWEIGASYEWLWIFIALTVWQVIFFAWIARVIPKPRSET